MFIANSKKSWNSLRQILDSCLGGDVHEIPLGVDSAEGRVAGLGSQHDFRGKVMKNAFLPGLRAFLHCRYFRSSFIRMF